MVSQPVQRLIKLSSKNGILYKKRVERYHSQKVSSGI
jgi:hypothetical protein